jgi:hypothetical protein
MAIARASTVRAFMRTELIHTGYCDVTVGSEFEWKATRRLARAVGKTVGMRVHSHLRPPSRRREWPRLLWIWDPDMEVDPRDLRKQAFARGAWADQPPLR